MRRSGIEVRSPSQWGGSRRVNASIIRANPRGLDHQTDRDFEVIIADDGSGAATREFLAWRAARLDRPLKHVWHEDRGFRAAEIRNRGILASSGDYCVFLDGDCIPRPNF